MTTHTKISYIKSAIRVVGYVALAFDIQMAMIVLLLSEAVGVIEEFGL